MKFLASTVMQFKNDRHLDVSLSKQELFLYASMALARIDCSSTLKIFLQCSAICLMPSFSASISWEVLLRLRTATLLSRLWSAVVGTSKTMK